MLEELPKNPVQEEQGESSARKHLHHRQNQEILRENEQQVASQ